MLDDKQFKRVYKLSSDVPPILIYQMGKVGSKTIKKSLQNANLDNFIGHAHELNSNRIVSEDQKIIRFVIDTFWSRERFKIITLVRDPVARMISAVFTNYQKCLPQIIPINNNNTVNQINKHFLQRLKNNDNSGWFDEHIKKVFYFDVYSKPFDKTKGYTIYKTKNADFLIIRLEDLNSCYKIAFDEFLNITNFKLINENFGANKWYASLYDKVLKTIRFPINDLEKIYSSKIAKHFYTNEELLRFKLKWMNQNASNNFAKLSATNIKKNINQINYNQRIDNKGLISMESFEDLEKKIVETKHDIPEQFIKFMLGRLHFYSRIGDSDRHYNYSLDGLNYIANQIRLNPESSFWQNILPKTQILVPYTLPMKRI
jgi:hypothetical protein